MEKQIINTKDLTKVCFYNVEAFVDLGEQETTFRDALYLITPVEDGDEGVTHLCGQRAYHRTYGSDSVDYIEVGNVNVLFGALTMAKLGDILSINYGDEAHYIAKKVAAQQWELLLDEEGLLHYNWTKDESISKVDFSSVL